MTPFEPYGPSKQVGEKIADMVVVRGINVPEDRLPVLEPSSQYSLVACRPVSVQSGA